MTRMQLSVVIFILAATPAAADEDTGTVDRHYVVYSSGADVISRTVTSEGKAIYSPYEHPYPQIIQNQDYATIQSIEFLYRQLAKAKATNVTVEVAGNGITFQLQGRSANQVQIRRVNPGVIAIDNRYFTNTLTVAFYLTLIRVLNDLSSIGRCQEISLDQHGTRAYRHLTNLDLRFPSGVMNVCCGASGPRDIERLYTLDLTLYTSEKTNFLEWVRARTRPTMSASSD